MKNFFFVSIALGIFTGTSISAMAQSPGNSVQSEYRSISFIENSGAGSDATAINMPAVSRENSPSDDINKINNILPSKKIHSIQFKYAQILNRAVETITNLPLFGFV